MRCPQRRMPSSDPRRTRDPGIGKFQRKPGQGQNNEAEGQNEMLRALGKIHAQNGAAFVARPRGGFAPENQRVVRRHQADDGENHAQV